MITLKLKRGAGIPTTEQLSSFELGWSVDNKKLYINDNGTIRLAAGAISVSLNGATASNEGTFSFFAPTSITGSQNKVVRMKSTFVTGEDPFEYLAIDSTPTSSSTNLITSGGVKSALDNKVDVNGTDRLITLVEASKLSGIESGAQVNIIETIQVDGVPLSVTSKTVNIAGKENTSNKETVTLTNSDTKYPSSSLMTSELAKKTDKSITSNGYVGTIDNLGYVNLASLLNGTGLSRLELVGSEAYLYKGLNSEYGRTDGTKLLNKAEIISLMTGEATRLITARTGSVGSYVYEPFATYAALIAGPWYYEQGSVSLTPNDYAFVKDDENNNGKQAKYVWDGTAWTLAITFAEDPLNPDNTTLEAFNTTFIRVKDLGITESKLASDSVTTSKIANANVTIAKLVSSIGSGNGRIIGYNSSNVANVINLNNNVANVTSLFAPTTSGTTGQYLEAVTDGAPIWKNFPTIPTITLNGSATTTPSFYAPTTVGESGQILISQGTGAPSWTSTIDGGSWT